jgi:outer membrane lipoprotein carrier protein
MIRLLLAFSLAWLSAPLGAQEGADRLEAFLDGLNTLRADFEQIVVTTGQGDARVSRGTFYLQRPGRFRWSYEEPEGQLVVADGERVWLYDMELAQVSHRNQADALRGTPALLLSDTAPVDRHFEVVDLGQRLDMDWVELIPRGEASEVTKVLVAFNGDSLQRLEMVDSFGQVTRFVFSNTQRNPALKPSLFRFTPPSGVDLLSH